MDTIKFAIFDMDGLLFDTERIAYLAKKRAMEIQGIEFNLKDFRKTIGLSKKEVEFTLQEIYGKNIDHKHLDEEYRAGFDRILKKEGLTLKPGAKELLIALEQKNIKKCVASSSSRETIAQYLNMSGIESFFSFYISGHDVSQGKPAPDIFLEACKHANEPVNKSIVLEDSLNGLRAAHKANIRCIIVPDLISPDNEIKEKSFSIIPNLTEAIPLIG